MITIALFDPGLQDVAARVTPIAAVQCGREVFMSQRRIQIAVIGGGTCSKHVRELAEEVGAELARCGVTLICGGLGGVMDAAACGVRNAGGLTVGIIPTYDAGNCSRSLDVVIATGFGHGRNVIVAATGDAVIALPGGHGTASEIALALTLGRCVIGLRAWEEYPGVIRARSAREAVERAMAAADARVRQS
jgi:uncharacterized protein (TIGR00725 family)